MTPRFAYLFKIDLLSRFGFEHERASDRKRAAIWLAVDVWLQPVRKPSDLGRACQRPVGLSADVDSTNLITRLLILYNSDSTSDCETKGRSRKVIVVRHRDAGWRRRSRGLRSHHGWSTLEAVQQLAYRSLRFVAALIVGALLFGQGDRLWAGECVDGDEAYLQDLQAIARGADKSSRYYGALCLAHVYGGGNRWAGPRAKKRFERRRRAAIRKPVAKICRAVFDRGRYWPAQICIRILASFGVKRVGQHDVFALQKKYVRYGLPPLLLALLGDQRATAQLIASFGSEKSCYEYATGDGQKLTRHCRSYEARSRNKWIRKEYDEQKISVLNALWHLADPASRSFLEKVSQTDPSKLVRDRARRALQVLPKSRSSTLSRTRSPTAAGSIRRAHRPPGRGS